MVSKTQAEIYPASLFEAALFGIASPPLTLANAADAAQSYPMKIAVWIVFALLAALWTGAALLFVTVSEWAAGLLASGQAEQLGTAAATMPLPPALALWIDSATVKLAQEGVLWLLNSARDVLPLLGSAMGWLEPVIWLLWLFGLVVMLVLAGAAHLLLGRVPSVQQLRQQAGI